MGRTWRVTCWRSLRRRLCAALTLVAYVLATLGLPLPAPARTPGEQPFPCQDHPCGCQSAEQCWTACCCFTPAQRWTWARERHIDPPAYAEKPETRGWRSPRLRDRAQSVPKAQPSCQQCAPTERATAKEPAGNKPGCAAEPSHPACCEPPTPSAPESRPAPGPTCQIAPARPGCHPTTSQPAREAKPAGKGTARWGLGVAALRCQGLSTLWATTGAALPPAVPLTWSPYLRPVAWLTAPVEFPCTLPSVPLEPPPRPHAV